METLGLRRNTQGRWHQPAGTGRGQRVTSTELRANLVRDHVRFPRILSLQTVFKYLGRAYSAEPQPGKRITEALTFLENLGFYFVWDGGWALECRACGKVYVRSGHAANHRCSPRPLEATSSELAKGPHRLPEASEILDRVLWDRPDVETSFEHAMEASNRARPSDGEKKVQDVDVSVESGLEASVTCAAGQPPAPEWSISGTHLNNENLAAGRNE
jgi:hypothetical protein